MNKLSFLYLLATICCSSVFSQAVSFGAAVDPMFGSVHLRGEVDGPKYLRVGLEWTRERPVLISTTVDGRDSYLHAWYLGAAIGFVQPLTNRWQLYGRTGVGLRRSGFGSESFRFGEFVGVSVEARMGGGIAYGLGRLRFFADAALRWKTGLLFGDPLVLAVGTSFAILKSEN